MNGGDRCKGAQIMNGLFKHSTENLQQEISSIATGSIVTFDEDSLTNFLYVGLDIFEAKNVPSNLFGAVIFSGESKLQPHPVFYCLLHTIQATARQVAAANDFVTSHSVRVDGVFRRIPRTLLKLAVDLLLHIPR